MEESAVEVVTLQKEVQALREGEESAVEEGAALRKSLADVRREMAVA